MDFTPIDNRGGVDGFCLIATVDKKTSSKGDAFLDLTLTDKTGKINGKVWNYSEDAYGTYEAGDIVKVRGTVTEYNGNAQLKIERIRKINEADGIRIEDYVLSADYDGEQMFDELYAIANNFEDAELKALVTGILTETKQVLLYWPAALKMHHAMRGGLLFHTLSIVRVCEGIVKVYPFVNKDLLFAGAILHDIAKTEEFEVGSTGIASAYSVKGNLLGHLAEGAIYVRMFAKSHGISEETSNLIEHMLLSHHGEPEFGAAVKPMFIEAQILSVADNLDANMFEMREAIEAVNVGEFTNRIFALDNRKFYNHGKYDFDKKTKLF